MARYSRRTFPAANFDLPVGFADIPQASLSRYFDDGEYLLLLAVFVANIAGLAQTPQFRLLLDGTALVPDVLPPDVPAGLTRTIHAQAFRPLAAGLHTFTVQGQADAPASLRLTLTRSTLSVIQFPQWDQESEIA